MADHCYPERGRSEFWQELGLDHDAAEAAANCFPEAFINKYSVASYWPNGDPRSTYDNSDPEGEARKTAGNTPLPYRTDATHPAFWFEQGCDFDEMARRAVAAITMLKLQQEAVPPPPQRDRFAEVAQALLMQGAMQQRLEGPDSYDDQDYGDPQPRGPAPPQRDPFDPDDYPRFQTRQN